MSYDVGSAIDGDRVELNAPLDLRGGTYVVGGTTEAWLNITYNYVNVFRELFGKDGIRALYSFPSTEVAIRLTNALASLNTLTIENRPCTCHDTLDCYWAVTKDNVRACLENLLQLSRAVPPEAILEGD